MTKSVFVGRSLSRAALAGATALALFGAPFVVGEAAAKVGVTSATDGDPLGKPPTEAERVLRIGIDVQANELITTQANDRAHLVFLDGSSLTVGPNAQLTIDKFVYDPATKTGDLAINASKGVFRLVGGKISKTRAIIITTPSSTIGIRGGITILDVKSNQTTSTFVFGTSMSVSAVGLTQNVVRPGSQVTTNAGGPPGPPTIVPKGALAAQLSQLEGGGGSGQSGGGGNADQAAQRSGFSTTNSGQAVVIVGLRPGDSFGTGPGPRNRNPNDTVVTALTNANTEQQEQQAKQQQAQQQQASQSPQEFQFPDIPLPEIDLSKFVFDPNSRLATVRELNNLNLQGATATYNGAVHGAVNNNGNKSAVSGTYQNVWSFGNRNGVATVQFDGAKFGGGPAPNTFAPNNSPVFMTNSSLPSTNGPTGRNLDLIGVFVSSDKGPATSQLGIVTVKGPNNYQGSGVFLGKTTP